MFAVHNRTECEPLHSGTTWEKVMALVAFSSPQRGALDNELHQFERIATSLSSRFTALALEDLDEAVAASLEDIRRTLGVEQCALAELGEPTGTVVQSWGGQRSLAELTDLLSGLGTKQEATSSVATLVVPVSIAGRVSCALVVESRGRRSGWTPPLIDRLRLIGEILGSALHRRRQERSLREMAHAARATDRTARG